MLVASSLFGSAWAKVDDAAQANNESPSKTAFLQLPVCNALPITLLLIVLTTVFSAFLLWFTVFISQF
jgi:hypothetical protein